MEKLIVSSSPHFNDGRTTQNIMLDVIIALVPAMVASVILFGFRAVVILTCVATCVLSEYLCRRVMKRPQTVGDLSCVVTGILLALNLPVTINPLIAVFGGVVAIVVVKQMFGGIGQNFVNPALTARIILLNSFPSRMTHWVQPFDYAATADAITTATPLGILKEGAGEALPSYLDLFLGNNAGCLGETCALAILIGGAYLIARRVISPVIPVTYLATAALFSALFGRDPLFDLLSGGLLLGAFFMATDYVTSPTTTKGKLIFGLGLGIITCAIRFLGTMAEGVSFSILLMNLTVPYIEVLTRQDRLGIAKVKKNKEGAGK